MYQILSLQGRKKKEESKKFTIRAQGSKKGHTEKKTSNLQGGVGEPNCGKLSVRGEKIDGKEPRQRLFCQGRFETGPGGQILKKRHQTGQKKRTSLGSPDKAAFLKTRF